MLLMNKLYLILLLFALSCPVFVHADTVQVQSLQANMGSIAPGKGGYNYERYAEVQVSCNVTSSPWELKVDLTDFTGLHSFAKENVRLKVFYIGKSLAGPPYWQNDATDLLVGTDFDGYSQADPFVEYSGSTMTVCKGAVPPGGNTIQVKLAITVQVPENKENMVGSYFGDLTFTLE